MMKCRGCGNEMFCQNSRPIDNYSVIREYGCAKCKKVYGSIEQLDSEPYDKEAQAKRIERWKREHPDVSTS